MRAFTKAQTDATRWQCEMLMLCSSHSTPIARCCPHNCGAPAVDCGWRRRRTRTATKKKHRLPESWTCMRVNAPGLVESLLFIRANMEQVKCTLEPYMLHICERVCVWHSAKDFIALNFQSCSLSAPLLLPLLHMHTPIHTYSVFRAMHAPGALGRLRLCALRKCGFIL